MEILGFIFYFIAGAFGRVWFGSNLESKVWSNRGLQTAFMLALLLSIFVCDYTDWRAWLVGAIISAWLQFQFWSRGHGACVDIGRDTIPSQDTIERYNERWYHIPCDWLFDKIKPEAKYGFLYDFIYTTLRYTCPMILMAFIDWRYLLIGLSIAPVYAFCQTLQEREPWVFEKQYWWWRRGWSLAEIISGGIVFSGCYLLGV